MDSNNKPSLALLIDADNISAKYLPIILNEIPRYGVTTYRRIYGDFTDPQAASWRQKLLDNNITPIQQFSNVKSHKRGEKAGKNATDSTLIIDAMDILYAGKVDGFVIVSSDSDFTRLASRLRESNMLVVGMGRNQTAISFRHACTKFVNIEALYKMENDKQSDQEASATSADSDDIETTVTLADVENVVAGIIRDDENKGRETTSLAIIGNSLNNKYPDFDVRNFGYSQLYKLIEELGRFELIKVDNGYNVSIKEGENASAEVFAFMIEQISARKNKQMGVAPLAAKVYKQFPSLNIKDTGYSQFYKFAASCEQLVVTGEGNRKTVSLVQPAEKAEEPQAEQAPKQQAKRTRRRRSRAVEAPTDKVEETPAATEQPVETAEQTPEEPSAAEAAADSTPAAEAASAPAAEKPARRRRTRKAEAADEPEKTAAAAAPTAPTKKEVYTFIEAELAKAKDSKMGIAQIGTKVRKHFPAFDLEKLGYKQFRELIEASKNIGIVGEGRSRKATLGK